MARNIGPEERRARATTSAEGILGLVASGRLGEVEPWVAYGAIDDVDADPEVMESAFPGRGREALERMYEDAFTQSAWLRASASAEDEAADRYADDLESVSRRSGVPMSEVERLRDGVTSDLHDLEARALLNRV